MSENSNKDSQTIPTQRDLLAGIMAKDFAQAYMIPKHVVAAHNNGDIHQHDQDYSPYFPSYNCMLIDLREMLENGFKLGNAQIETPKSITTAAAVTAQIIAQVSSHIYGSNTINEIDRVLAPYVTKSFVKHFKTGMKWLYNADPNYIETLNISVTNLKVAGQFPKCYDFLQAVCQENPCISYNNPAEDPASQEPELQNVQHFRAKLRRPQALSGRIDGQCLRPLAEGTGALARVLLWL